MGFREVSIVEEETHNFLFNYHTDKNKFNTSIFMSELDSIFNGVPNQYLFIKEKFKKEWELL